MAGVAALLFFAWLADEVARGHTMGFDLAVRAAIHARSSPSLTVLWIGVTRLGEPWFVIPLSLVLAAILARRGNKSAALALAGATIGGDLLDEILKAIFHRVRPEAFFGFPQPRYYSFPSGHAMVSACFYGALAVILASGGAKTAAYWIFGAGMPLAIGFSRVYLGVHYPTDVLAGYAAAIVWLTAVFRLRRLHRRGAVRIP